MVTASGASRRARSLQSSLAKGVASSDPQPSPLSAEASYKLGAALWHSRCHARLQGDLLLIERSGKQEAAVSLRGATINFSAPSSVRIHTVSSPVLTLQLSSQDEAQQWSLALSRSSKGTKGADHHLQALQGKLEDFQSLKESAARTEAELQRALRQVEQAVADLREGEKKACAQQDAMQAQLNLEAEARRKTEDQVRDLEAKLAAELEARKSAQAQVTSTELKLTSEIAARKSAEEQCQTLHAQLALELEERQESEKLGRALEQELASESEFRKVAEVRVRELERSLSAAEETAASDRRRLVAAEARLTAEKDCRKAAEENRASLENRLASAEQEIEMELARRRAKECMGCTSEAAGSLVATS
eukprot:TRINITY_DN33021_c0_g1_i1.p1 TRINITY_DN33021_c0_g1~~TRINITY_DN33021_c0_g1_i1.p1  ORF type:complete len:380 (-),score=101.22 TRINITY_DN33021_c0_g1_i1:83-1174(-)